VAAAALDRFNAEAADRAAAEPNSYALVRAAQTELIRLGCFNGRPDGALASTQTALKRYLSIIGLPADNLAVTPDVVTDMTKHTTQVCPPECQSGETLKGGSCVADAKPADTPARKGRPEQKEKEQARRDKPAKEKQQARARPSVVGGGVSMTGIGF
jgi:peptidoglycan hydrolase-like protein with peptidoglycan-binding domain